MAIDLDNIAQCPFAPECEVCDGQNGAVLDVVTVTTLVGVYCATLCDKCAEAFLTPGPLAAATAIDRVLQHCWHLGIDADQMAAAMAEEG